MDWCLLFRLPNKIRCSKRLWSLRCFVWRNVSKLCFRLHQRCRLLFAWPTSRRSSPKLQLQLLQQMARQRLQRLPIELSSRIQLHKMFARIRFVIQQQRDRLFPHLYRRRRLFWKCLHRNWISRFIDWWCWLHLCLSRLF